MDGDAGDARGPTFDHTHAHQALIKDPWHPQERPDPKGFVRTAPTQICLDSAWPTQFFWNFVRMGPSGHFFAQIWPNWSFQHFLIKGLVPLVMILPLLNHESPLLCFTFFYSPSVWVPRCAQPPHLSPLEVFRQTCVSTDTTHRRFKYLRQSVARNCCCRRSVPLVGARQHRAPRLGTWFIPCLPKAKIYTDSSQLKIGFRRRISTNILDGKH